MERSVGASDEAGVISLHISGGYLGIGSFMLLGEMPLQTCGNSLTIAWPNLFPSAHCFVSLLLWDQTDEVLEKPMQEGTSDEDLRCWETVAQAERMGPVVELQHHMRIRDTYVHGHGDVTSIPKARDEGKENGKPETKQDCVAWSSGLGFASAGLD